MKKARVAINGFGRIGRTFFRLAHQNPHFEVVAINDLGNLENLAYLLEYDTAYGRSPFHVVAQDGALVIDGRTIYCSSEKDPLNLPWKSLDIDVVVESTGIFTSYEKANVHRVAGAKRVVISAPVKDEDGGSVRGKTVLMGVNEDELAHCDISSNASCTTNATSPLVAILDATIGIEKAILNTVHAYTASQSLVDGPSKKDLREGRAAAENIVPSSTGAATATALVHTQLKDKFDGISIRVPVPVGSLLDVTFIAKRDTTVEEVNGALARAAESAEWADLFSVTNAPLVSSDIIGARCASIADLAFTRVVGGNLVKVLAWYDNETSYTHTLVRHVERVITQLGV
ncbi:MAG TPA: glyceraldehyde 3-phosphate dehydrogenase NAD-binding domain-containing protein [Candidatus Paceibacterota bacterium]|nr:glyceraldehyde 3-phosphate dehydrogenase NAD-binding domain-containing protein [Candidatus Paceibacterota bacterium]